MLKTADLERSKRLKELGWDQIDGDRFYSLMDESEFDCADRAVLINDGVPVENFIVMPTAGEMIEWLLGEGCIIDIVSDFITVRFKGQFLRLFSQDGLCNALADAVIWVLERKV